MTVPTWINTTNVTGAYNNITTLEQLAAFDNTVTGGWYAPVLVLTVFMITLFVTANHFKARSLVVASFFAAVTSAFLWALGLLGGEYLAICTAALVGTTIILAKE